MRALSQSQAVAIRSLRSPAGGVGIGVVVKHVRSYRSRTAPEAVVLLEEHYDGEELIEDTDTTAVHKPATDVIVRGSAFARSARPSIDVNVRVGSLARGVRVHAPRRIRQQSDGTLDFEPTGEIELARLTYTEAYGGGRRSSVLPRRGAFGARGDDDRAPSSVGYLRNPLGRGFCVRGDTASLDGTLAPSQEPLESPLEAHAMVREDWDDWANAPTPGGLGPVDVSWFPRAHFLLPRRTRDGSVPVEVSEGVLSPSDLARSGLTPDPRVLCCAPAGLGGRRLRGDESVSLTGTTWGNGEVQLGLDATAPHMRLGFPGAGIFEVALRLGTVVLNSDDETVTLVWGGFQPTALPYPADQLEQVRAVIGG